MDFFEKAVIKENNFDVTRLKIVTALFAHLSKDDEVNITMVEIAKIAGLSRKSVYNHFENINEIHRELQFLIIQSLLLKAYIKVIAIKDTPLKTFEYYLESLHTILSDNLDILAYIIKSDFYILRARNPIDITIPNMILERGLITHYIQSITPTLSGEEVVEKSKMIIEAFLGFSTRITLRSKIVIKDNYDIKKEFKLFLCRIKSLYRGEDLK